MSSQNSTDIQSSLNEKRLFPPSPEFSAAAHIPSMAEISDADAPLLGRMAALGTRLMRELGVTGGFRHVINTGRDGGQEVYHLHLHVMGGPRPWLKG